MLLVVFASRYALLRVTLRTMVGPLLWIAPRGLITVLLFLTARETLAIPAYLNGAVILVVLGSSILILAARSAFAKEASTLPDAAAAPSVQAMPPTSGQM